MSAVFEDREQAGELLAQKILAANIPLKESVVVGIARGGVVVASVIARILGIPLAAISIKKISHPQSPELALGAIGPAHTTYWEEAYLHHAGIKKSSLRPVVSEKYKELKAQERLFGRAEKEIEYKNKTILLADDGIATGATVLCAYKSLKKKHPSQIILTTPVVGKDTLFLLERAFPNIFALYIPQRFRSVGEFYVSFPQVTTEEVVELLNRAYGKNERT